MTEQEKFENVVNKYIKSAQDLNKELVDMEENELGSAIIIIASALGAVMNKKTSDEIKEAAGTFLASVCVAGIASEYDAIVTRMMNDANGSVDDLLNGAGIIPEDN